MMNLFNLVVLFIIALAVFNGVKHTETTDYLQVKCASGSDLKLQPIRCEKVEKAGALLRITVNRVANVVLVEVIENNDQFFIPWFYLDRCQVAAFNNWKCGNTSVSDKVDSEYGVYNGRYFQSTTGGGSTNYYTAGMTGWRLWAYQHDLISLKTAIDWG
jgi:hypothetical protein